jgi:hypothetical protein
MTYPDEPEGVWGKIFLDKVINNSNEEFLVNGNGNLPITRFYQSLKAMEEAVKQVSPHTAKYIRQGFDSLEGKAFSDFDSALWKSGKYLFPLLGLGAEMLLGIAGKSDMIGKQYVTVNNSESKWVSLPEILSNPRISNYDMKSNLRDSLS